MQQFLFRRQIAVLATSLRRIRFTVLDKPKKGRHHLSGRFAIRQTDFGITPFTTALGAIGVADELTIFGELWAHEPTVCRIRSRFERKTSNWESMTAKSCYMDIADPFA